MSVDATLWSITRKLSSVHIRHASSFLRRNTQTKLRLERERELGEETERRRKKKKGRGESGKHTTWEIADRYSQQKKVWHPYLAIRGAIT